MSLQRLIAAYFTLAVVAGLSAQVTISGFSQTGSLAANDDDYTNSAQSLGFSINFNGTTYSSAFVSNNGYITFGSGSNNWVYSPSSFNASYGSNSSNPQQIIAAFFSDVDTRHASSGIVTWGTATVGGRNAFVVNWNNVGEYGAGTFSPNDFKLVLVDRSDLGTGSFDVNFIYNTITWDHDGAVIGYHSSGESTVYYQLPGSLTSGAFLNSGPNSLTSTTNAGSNGSFKLSSVNGTFLAAAQVVPEPSTWILLATGGALLALGARRRRSEKR